VALPAELPGTIPAVEPGRRGQSMDGTIRELETDCNLTRGIPMLWTIAVVLMLLWLVGMVSSYTMGGFIHILLVLAVVTVLIRLITGRKIVQ
jgi:hypothetical protein